MKKGWITLVTSVVLIASSPASPLHVSASSKAVSAPADDSMLQPILRNVAVIAHRGASAYAPEHTLEAYEQAIRMKADYVEIDLQMTKDGRLIALHDETLSRTTNAKQLYPDRSPWSVKDFTLEEIRKLDAGSWFNEAYPDMADKSYAGLKVPTLEEAIELVERQGKGKIGLYIETKAPDVYPGMEEKLAAALKQYDLIDQGNVILQSFSEDSLRKLKKLAPSLPLVQLYSAAMLKDKDIYAEIARISDYASGVGPTKSVVTPKLMDAAHQNGLFVHPYTVNNEEEMVSLLSLGVDGMFTNNSDLLEELLKKPYISHGVAVGDVTDSSAVLWARASGESDIQFEISTDPGFTHETAVKNERATAERDYTAQVKVDRLKPDTVYYYRAQALPGQYTESGSFRTAPEDGSLKPVSFVWGGDMGGQGEIPPFQSFKSMAALNPDFFLFNGDTIYADNKTPSVPNPPSDSTSDFWAKYKENRTDSGLRSLLQKTAAYAVWDDHEVINDFSGPTEPLTPLGLQSFKDFWPVSSERSSADKLYHTFSWGNTMDLILLNNRGYRDPNTMADGPDKTMLGQEQLNWLLHQLETSDAKVKLVASSVPISIPTGKAGHRDGWANGEPSDSTGYENEFRKISDFIIQKGIKNVYFVTTDVHYADIIQYDASGDGKTDYRELISGPLGAGQGDPKTLDPTFGPERLYAEGGFFNFGACRIDPERKQFTVEIRDETGKVHFSHTFPLED